MLKWQSRSFNAATNVCEGLHYNARTRKRTNARTHKRTHAQTLAGVVIAFHFSGCSRDRWRAEQRAAILRYSFVLTCNKIYADVIIRAQDCETVQETLCFMPRSLLATWT